MGLVSCATKPLFGSGLRLGETLNLKIRGIDSERMKVHVRMGKKDRFVNLPEASLRVLPAYSVNNRDRFI
jgi:integrase/recombinase XerD